MVNIVAPVAVIPETPSKNEFIGFKPKNKYGFTIIETLLFLVLSGALAVGLIVGTSASISRQRYNESVNGVSDFLRGVYSSVNDVKNESINEPGRSDKAIYGKAVFFGEGELGDPDSSIVYVYDIIGNVVSSSIIGGSSDSLSLLLTDAVDGRIIDEEESAGTCIKTVYGQTSFRPTWGSRLEQTDSHELAKTALLIIRSPISGATTTYVVDYRSSIQSMLANSSCTNPKLSDIVKDDDIIIARREEFNLCIESDDRNTSLRRNVRIYAGGSGSSSVYLPPADLAYNATTAPEGNKCQ